MMGRSTSAAAARQKFVRRHIKCTLCLWDFDINWLHNFLLYSPVPDLMTIRSVVLDCETWVVQKFWCWVF